MARKVSFVLLVWFLLLSTACAGRPASPTPQPNMPNPASVYCVQHGGRLELRTDATGAVTGFCVFPDKSECEEWAYFRGECQPGDSLRAPSPSGTPAAATPATAPTDAPATAAATRPGPTAQANMPNPASVYCVQHGGRLDLRQDAAGGVSGVCVFPNGTECDEWAYFRGECQPGAAPTAAPEIASDGWSVYRNQQLGYSFHYPPQASLGIADDPLKSLTIAGPLVAGDHWPTIFINHPSDRAYRPPEGVALEQWLTDHNLLPTGRAAAAPGAEVRQPDLTLAGTLAIHTRLPRSPQTYAYDKYFFARSQQLYQIVILHTADKEDWTIYNHFLQSFQFQS